MTKKLVLAVLSVVAVFAALGTTTFAWFSLTKDATLDKITVQMESGTGMEISLDGSLYKTSFTSAEIEARITTLYPGAVNAGGTVEPPKANDKFVFGGMLLTAVTPATVGTDSVAFDTVLNKDTKFYQINPTVEPDDDDIAAQLTPISPNVGYIEFPLYVRAMNVDKVYWVNEKTEGGELISPITSVSANNKSKPFKAEFAMGWNVGAAAKLTANTWYKVDAENAVRVSVGDMVYEKPATTPAPGAGAATEDATQVKYGNNVLGDGTAGKISNLYGGLAFIESKHAGSLTDLITIAANGIHSSMTQLKAVDASTNPNEIKLNVTEGQWNYYGEGDAGEEEIAPLMVRIWVEGWDPECFDAIFDDRFAVDFKFSTEQIAA